MGKKPSGPVPRQAANSGNHENQSNAPPSSLSSQKAKTVSENPVGGTVNDDSDKASKEVTTTDRDLCYSLSVISLLYCRLNKSSITKPTIAIELTTLSFFASCLP